MEFSINEFRNICFVIEEVVLDEKHPFWALRGGYEEDMCNAARFIKAGWKKMQAALQNENTTIVTEMDTITTNEEEETAPLAVQGDNIAKLSGENAFDVFLRRWEKLKASREVSFDEDCENMMHSLNKSDGFFDALPGYSQEIFEVLALCGLCTQKTNTLNQKRGRHVR